MKYHIIQSKHGTECDLEPTICTDPYCSHPCYDCGFTFDEAKQWVVNYYQDKAKRLSKLNEKDWENY